MASSMEELRKTIPEISVLDKEELAKGTALTNEDAAQLVADLARDGRRYFSTIKALEDALSVVEDE